MWSVSCVIVSDRLFSCSSSLSFAFPDDFVKSVMAFTRSMLPFHVGMVRVRLESSASGLYIGIIFIPACPAGVFFFTSCLWLSLCLWRLCHSPDMDSLFVSPACSPVNRCREKVK